ncbi:MAG: FAD-binding domain-containing protein [Acidobacteriota bacterium]
MPASPSSAPSTFRPTRADALARLEAFVPRAGRDYAHTRNHDRGPDGHANVSQLSPYLRLRLLRESEVTARVLADHDADAAEKFLQEVAWRTYWKGWLALRPSVWDAYLDAVVDARCDVLDRDRALRQRHEDAVTGTTDIACFDAWANELTTTGYLHNHARMWFASIWIFTLGLPWASGAAFFLRHLLDGDAASNTLSWRWVAGLQTRNKHYLARASNIRRFTDGRFDPRGDLVEAAEALPWTEPPRRGGLPDWPQTVPAADADDGPLGLLLHGDDACAEASPLTGDGGLRARRRALASVASAWAPSVASGLDLAAPVVAFHRGALDDARARAADAFGCAAVDLDDEVAARAADARSDDGRDDAYADAVVDWARAQKLRTVLVLAPAVGAWEPPLGRARAALEAAGCRVTTLQRTWDAALHPHATHGFFRFRKSLPDVWDAIGRFVEPTQDGG